MADNKRPPPAANKPRRARTGQTPRAPASESDPPDTPGPVETALNESLAAVAADGDQLEPAPIAAAYHLARKIDQGVAASDRYNHALDRWQASGQAGRAPTLPTPDNSSLVIFLQYLNALGLTVPGRERITLTGPTHPTNMPTRGRPRKSISTSQPAVPRRGPPVRPVEP